MASKDVSLLCLHNTAQPLSRERGRAEGIRCAHVFPDEQDTISLCRRIMHYSFFTILYPRHHVFLPLFSVAFGPRQGVRLESYPSLHLSTLWLCGGSRISLHQERSTTSVLFFWLFLLSFWSISFSYGVVFRRLWCRVYL